MNLNEYNKLNDGERHLVDWVIEIGGDFYKHLFICLAHADRTNRVRFSMAFPEETQAFMNYSTVSGWWQKLEKRLEL